MTDIVERLRTSWAVEAQVDLHDEAADEIERLRAALMEIKRHTPEETFDGFKHKVHELARAALEQGRNCATEALTEGD